MKKAMLSISLVVFVFLAGCGNQQTTPEQVLDNEIQEQKEHIGNMFIAGFRAELRKDAPGLVEDLTPAAEEWWGEVGEEVVREAFLATFPDRDRMVEVLKGGDPTVREMETLMVNAEREAEKRFPSLLERWEKLDL